jgi:hypothetical protein
MEEDKEFTEEELEALLKAYKDAGYDAFILDDELPGLENDIDEELSK